MKLRSLFFVLLLVVGAMPLYSQSVEKMNFKELLKEGYKLKGSIRSTLTNDLGAVAGKEKLGKIDGTFSGLFAAGSISGEMNGSAKNIGAEVFNLKEPLFEGFEDLFASMKQLIKDNPNLPQSDCFKNFYKLFEDTIKTKEALKKLQEGDIKKLKTVLDSLVSMAIEGKDVSSSDLQLYEDLYTWAFGSYIAGITMSNPGRWTHFEADVGLFQKELYIDFPGGWLNDCDSQYRFEQEITNQWSESFTTSELTTRIY